jgi:hypothetical protein
MEGARDHVRQVLAFQGRTQQWLAQHTGISIWRLTRLLAGESNYWDWEAEQVALALQVPVGVLFPNPSTLRKSGRQRGIARLTPPETSAKAVAS